MPETPPLALDLHPLLHLGAFVTEFPKPLGESPSPDWLLDQLAPGVDVPVEKPDDVHTLVRDLFRHGGYKPTGRGKPASEYLVRAVGEGKLGPINLAVDACNVISFHSGLPISVVDLDLCELPLRVGLAPEDAAYVFNRAEQIIKFGGLVCLQDAQGPCANGVKDSQRTKTHEATTRTLSLVWGPSGLSEHVDASVAWYRESLERAGARTEMVR